VKEIFLLGGTGSVGLQVVDVIIQNNKLFHCIGLSISTNDDLNFLQIKRLNPKYVILRKRDQLKHYKFIFPNVFFFVGIKHFVNVLSILPKEVLIFNALSGVDGIKPTIDTIKYGFTLALANKECYVGKGALINRLLIKYPTKIIPVDSEISSLFQLIEYLKDKDEVIEKYGITASGGPLRDKTKDELKDIKVSNLLHHPTWKMGSKITIDSASLLNKAFEIVEASNYFKVPISKLEAMMERTSHIHAYVKTNKNTYYYIDTPDMRSHIYYSLMYPDVEFSKNIFTSTREYKLEPLNTANFPLYNLCLNTYQLHPNKMIKLIKLSQKGVKLLLCGTISYSQFIDYMLNNI
jgi:1-deoxy-D-xylulose-5-phosphate reductoisomerase